LNLKKTSRMGHASSKREKGTKSEPSGYKYAQRKMPYRTERLEISSEEKKHLLQLLQEAVPPEQKDEAWQQEPGRVKVIFDTDIGTDIDDSLALLMLLHLPQENIELLGVTTTYGFTKVRARVAQEIMSAWEMHSSSLDGEKHQPAETDEKKQGDIESEAQERGKKPSSIPVIAGSGIELGTHRNVWHTGTEGMGLFPLEEIDKMMSAQKQETEEKIRRKEKRTNEAAEFIAAQVLKYPNQVVLLGLGALTNVADALALNPDVAANIKKLVYMGMGHRMKEAQTDDFPFQSPNEPFEIGHG